MGLFQSEATIHPHLAEAANIVAAISLNLCFEIFGCSKLQQYLNTRVEICVSINQQIKVFDANWHEPQTVSISE